MAGAWIGKAPPDMERPSLPEGVTALLFDVDGVLTDTARVHAKAWKATFDDALERLGGDQEPFDIRHDYEAYVDGRSRLDGVRGFLQARGIDLPEGSEDDAQQLTVRGIGKAKNDRVLALIHDEGVEGYNDAGAFVRAARERGYKTAVVSSSANARAALRSVGLEDCFDTWVDGVRIDRDRLKGKPAPDTFAAAARDLGVGPEAAAVFEDAEAGVEAGHAGGFGIVVGVDRTGHADALREHGADVVVEQLTDVQL
jgi:beta-phosphoglucomutase family hydrolase